MSLHIVVLDMVDTSLTVTSAPRTLRLGLTDIVVDIEAKGPASIVIDIDVEASDVLATTDVDVDMAAAAGVPAVGGAMVGAANTPDIRIRLWKGMWILWRGW